MACSSRSRARHLRLKWYSFRFPWDFFFDMTGCCCCCITVASQRLCMPCAQPLVHDRDDHRTIFSVLARPVRSSSSNQRAAGQDWYAFFHPALICATGQVRTGGGQDKTRHLDNQSNRYASDHSYVSQCSLTREIQSVRSDTEKGIIICQKNIRTTKKSVSVGLRVEARREKSSKQHLGNQMERIKTESRVTTAPFRSWILHSTANHQSSPTYLCL